MKAKGRGFGIYTKGEQITNITDVHTGALLLEHCKQFNANNIIIVTRELDERVMVHFVNPFDWTERMGEDFIIWNFELTPDNRQLWRAVPRQREVL